MKHKNNITFIHLISAMFVVYGHQFILMGANPPIIIGYGIHKLGVSILFVISGYLITQSYLNSKGIWEYLKKRFFRIYPPFIV